MKTDHPCFNCKHLENSSWKFGSSKFKAKTCDMLNGFYIVVYKYSAGNDVDWYERIDNIIREGENKCVNRKRLELFLKLTKI